MTYLHYTVSRAGTAFAAMDGEGFHRLVVLIHTFIITWGYT